MQCNEADSDFAMHDRLPRLRDRVPLVWVAGYCNDMFGYVPTRAVLSEGGYEGGRSVLWSALPMPFAAETEDRVMDTVRTLLTRVKI